MELPAARTLIMETPMATRIQATTISPVVRSFSSNRLLRLSNATLSVAGLGPGLQLLDAIPAAFAVGVEAGLPGVADAVHGTHRHAEPAVDAVLEDDGEPADEVVLELVDGVDLARAGVIAGAAADAGVLDVEVTDPAPAHSSTRYAVVILADSFMNSCRFPLKRKNMSRSSGSSAHSRIGTPGRLRRLSECSRAGRPAVLGSVSS